MNKNFLAVAIALAFQSAAPVQGQTVLTNNDLESQAAQPRRDAQTPDSQVPPSGADGQSLPAVEVRAAFTRENSVPARNVTTGVVGENLTTPFSVTAVPMELVGAQAGQSLQDALRNVPGAQADSGFNGAHTQFFVLRGAIADSGTGSNRVLRDGVRLSNYPFVKAFVESVDVLRGPGAALGLRSEPGGTVNLISKQPEMSNFGALKASVGSSGGKELTADLNRVISAEDELAARLIVTRSAASEWRDVKDELDGAKLSVSKADGNLYHLRVSAEATDQTYQPDYGIPAVKGKPIDVPLDRQYGEPWDDSSTENRIVDVHFDVALHPNLRLNVDWTHLEARSTSIKSGLTGDMKNASGNWGRFSSYEPGTDRMIDSLATTLESQYRWGDFAHRMLWGADHYRETLKQPTHTNLPGTVSDINVYNPVYGQVGAPTALNTASVTKQDLESSVVSVQDQIEWGPWTVIAGVRYVQQDFMFGTQGTQSVEETKWLPKLGVLRKLTPVDSVYANAAEGMSPNQVSSSSNQSLPSRHSRQVEVGWKSLWNSGRLASDIAIYQLDQSNMIANDQSTPSNFDFTVDGSARSRGLEASVTGEIARRLNVNLAYAYTDARMEDHPLYSGLKAPNVAEHAYTIWGQYQWAFASQVQWLTSAGLYGQSKRYADRANTTELPSYARLDVAQTWRAATGGASAVEVQLAIRNLLDEKYYVSSHLHTSRWIMPGEGRNAWLTVSYKF